MVSEDLEYMETKTINGYEHETDDSEGHGENCLLRDMDANLCLPMA
jgi:hypothetical protein